MRGSLLAALLLSGCGATAQDACSPEALEATTVACEIAIEAAPSEAAARAEFTACLAAVHQWRDRCA